MEQKRKAKRQTRVRRKSGKYNSRLSERYIRVDIIEYSDKDTSETGQREILNRRTINVLKREFSDVENLIESLNIVEDYDIKSSHINLNY